MKVTSERLTVRAVRSATITDGQPTVHMAYSNPPKKVAIDHVNVTYTYADGRWDICSPSDVKVAGTVLKKDGSPSLNRHSRWPNGTGYGASKVVLDEGWEWLQAIVDLLRPSGELSVMILNEAEVKEA